MQFACLLQVSSLQFVKWKGTFLKLSYYIRRRVMLNPHFRKFNYVT